MGIGSDPPRRHHYEYAHRALPALLLRAHIDLLGMAAEGRLTRALVGTWGAIGDDLPESDRLSPDGLAAEVVDVAGSPSLLITLPPAERSTEAHLVAVTPCEPGHKRRYFTLEHSWSLDGQPGTVIGEWSTTNHLNWGAGPVSDRAAFVRTLERRCLNTRTQHT